MTAGAADITLFGATGFTGQLITRALDQAGFSYRISGRSREKLTRLSAELNSNPAWIVADASIPATIPSILQNTKLVINCAGPFTDLGDRVIMQAAMSGVHYLDITNELGFVFRSRGYHEIALRTGAAIVPGYGFEVSLADCAAHIAAQPLVDQKDSQPLDEIRVTYSLPGNVSSKGTRRSALRTLATSWISYRNSAWVGQIPGSLVQQIELPGGPAVAYSFPSCESITVPMHVPVRDVNTWMQASAGARFWAPVAIPLLARLSRSVLRGLILRIGAQGGVSADSAQDAAARSISAFTIHVQARRGEKSSSLTLRGTDPYGLTAQIIAYAAGEMVRPGYACRGFLAPAQAVDPQAFLETARDRWGISIQQY